MLIPQLEWPTSISKTVRSPDGIRIRYATLGDGETLVLLHGFMASLESWIDTGYTAGFADRKLILIDARGHGGSDRPHDPEFYAPERPAADIAAVLDAEGIRRADVAGYSMGGWNALAFQLRYPHRVRRLAIGGSHPFAQSLAPLRALVASGPDGWRKWLETHAGPVPQETAEQLSSNDPAALAALVAFDRPDLSDRLRGSGCPCMVYVGAKDPMRASCELAARLPNSGVFRGLPGLNHITAFLRSDVVLPHLQAFFQLDGGRR